MESNPGLIRVCIIEGRKARMVPSLDQMNKGVDIMELAEKIEDYEVENESEENPKEKHETTSLEILKAKLNELDGLIEVINQNEELKKQYSYLSMGISKLINWIIENNQLELNYPCTEVKYTNKVIRFHGYVDKLMTDREGIDLLFCGGIFMVAPICILPADRVNKIWNYKYKCVNQSKVPEVGLPSSRDVNYGTIRQYDENKYVVIAKTHTYLDDMLYTAGRYEIVYIQ